MGCSFVAPIQKAVGSVVNSDVGKVVAPIVAGAILGPAAGALVGTSAATGAAIAGAATGALQAGTSGGSVLGGALTGAVGGYGGGSLAGLGEVDAVASGLRAANPTMTAAQAATAAQAYVDAGYTAASLGLPAASSSTLAKVAGSVISPSSNTGGSAGGTAAPGWVSAAGALLPTVANIIDPVPTPAPNVTTSTNVYSPAEQAQRDYMLAEARRVYDAAVAAEIANGNPNAAVAPQSPDTIAAQNALRTYATGAATAMTQEQQAAQTYGLTTAMDVNNNPYLQSAIQAALTPIAQSYTDPNGVLSLIRSDSVQSGQYGGTRQGLGEGVAAGRFLQVVGDTSAKMASDAYNKGQDTFSKTLALSPSLVQSGQQPAQMLSAIGTQNEAFGQEQLNSLAGAKQWEAAKGFQPLANFTNLINSNSNPVTTSTAPPTPAPRKNLVGDAVSGAILANQVWGTLNKGA